MYVNRRFYINSENSPPEEREIFLRVTGPDGKQLPFRTEYDTGLPKSDSFVLLEAQAEVTAERKKNLKAYFNLKTPGEYTVVAIYQNVYGAEIGVDAFRGKLISKPVKIKIAE